MGDAARRTTGRLRDGLAERRRDLSWHAEFDIGGTPVDVAGVGDETLVVVELEWRRADPVDNTAKLFRALDGDALAEYRNVRVAQVFTGYYDLASGGVSSKRANATFVGERVAASFDRVSFRDVRLSLDPPKRGEALPDSWATAVDATLAELDDYLDPARNAE